MIIAVDFDGTLCADAYPEIGAPNQYLIEQLKLKREQGTKLILWTCRSHTDLADAVEWCKQQGLEFDAVNDNLSECTMRFGNNSRKIYADIYLDDKACSPLDTVGVI